MSEPDASAVVGEHLNLILRWWVVIVAVVSLGYAGVRRGIVAPRAELDRLGNEVSDLRDDLSSACMRNEALERKVDHLMELMLRLHAHHGLEEELG